MFVTQFILLLGNFTPEQVPNNYCPYSVFNSKTTKYNERSSDPQFNLQPLTFMICFGASDSFGVRGFGISLYSPLYLHTSFCCSPFCHFLSVPVASLPLQSCSSLSMSLTTWSASILSWGASCSTCSRTHSISPAAS